MIIVGLSVVVTVIVLQYHHHDPDGGKMPKWVSFFFIHYPLHKCQDQACDRVASDPCLLLYC